MPAEVRDPAQIGKGGRRWCGLPVAAAAVLVVLLTTSGIVSVLLVVLVLTIVLEHHLNFRARSASRRR